MTCEQTVTLNGVTAYGNDPDATYRILQPGISGLGAPPVNGSDLGQASEHGSVSGPDRTGPRSLRIPIAVVVDEDPQGAMQAFRTLQTAWNPVSGDQTLSVTIPGVGPSDDTLRFFGRPRGSLEPNLRAHWAGVVYCLATFVALDPVGYGPEETVNDSGTFAVTNSGDASSRRATVTITSAAATCKLENTTDGGAFIEFADAPSTVVIDLYARTVVDGGGADIYGTSEVAIGDLVVITSSASGGERQRQLHHRRATLGTSVDASWSGASTSGTWRCGEDLHLHFHHRNPPIFRCPCCPWVG